MKMHVITQGKYSERRIVGVVSDDPANFHSVPPGIMEQPDIEVHPFLLNVLLNLQSGQSPYAGFYTEGKDEPDAWRIPLDEWADSTRPEWDNGDCHYRKVVASSEEEAHEKIKERFETEGLVGP